MANLKEMWEASKNSGGPQKYILLDTQGKPLRQRFSSWLDADHYRHMMGRPDWKIQETHFSSVLHLFLNPRKK